MVDLSICIYIYILFFVYLSDIYFLYAFPRMVDTNGMAEWMGCMTWSVAGISKSTWCHSIVIGPNSFILQMWKAVMTVAAEM